MRSPAALLWLPPGPVHFVSSGLVPIRVSSLRLKVSVVPSNSTDSKGSRSTVTSFASAGLTVMPARHRAAPEATGIPFLDSSARRSNLVPMSSLFFRPTHAWRLLEEGRSPEVRAGWAAHVPIVTHGFPPAKFTLAESLYLAVAAVGAKPSRKSVLGLALLPEP